MSEKARSPNDISVVSQDAPTDLSTYPSPGAVVEEDTVISAESHHHEEREDGKEIEVPGRKPRGERETEPREHRHDKPHEHPPPHDDECRDQSKEECGAENEKKALPVRPERLAPVCAAVNRPCPEDR